MAPLCCSVSDSLCPLAQACLTNVCTVHPLVTRQDCESPEGDPLSDSGTDDDPEADNTEEDAPTLSPSPMYSGLYAVCMPVRGHPLTVCATAGPMRPTLVAAGGGVST